MLPLLPALLLLIFRGPTGIERGQLDFRFPIADYRLERPGAESNSSQRGVAALLALSKNPAFSRTVAELLRYLPADAANVAPDMAADVASAGVGQAIAASALALAAGFAVLAISPVPAVRDFGIWSALDLLLATLAVLTLLPPLARAWAR